MTPSAIIALARDAIILVALGLLIWLLITFGQDRVKVADMTAVQKQIIQNAQIEAGWRKEQTDANNKRDADLAQVAAGIAAQRAPVYVVRNAPRACPVPVNTGQASRPPPAAGGIDPGSGNDRQPVDIRPEINRFELRVESALADCRAALDGWPK
jgi:hypothetical protein